MHVYKCYPEQLHSCILDTLNLSDEQYLHIFFHNDTMNPISDVDKMKRCEKQALTVLLGLDALQIMEDLSLSSLTTY